MSDPVVTVVVARPVVTVVTGLPGPVGPPGGAGTIHAELTGLDAADSHPTSAITGLNAALALKAPLASPALTGTPTAPTAAGGTSTTQVATTAFSRAEVSTHAAATDPHGDRAFASSAVSTHASAAGAHPISGVDGLASALALLAPLLSPALTGTPTAPTAAPGTASTQLATTAFVAAAIAALLNSAPGALDTLDELAAALGDDPNFATTVTNALAGKLAKASNLADLVDAAAARSNLGAGAVGAQVFTAATAAAIRTLLELGGAALLNTGTTAGTLAAGDDSRITGAVQSARSVSTQHSLAGGGDLSADRTLSLVGDTASPGNSKIYGTNGSGVRGWYDQPSGASPGGSGSELQYRGGSTTFSAASGTHWDAANGRLSIGAGTSPSAALHVACDSASERVAIFQAATSQTANIIETRNSSGTALTAISATGHLLMAEQQTISLRGDPAGLGDYGLVYSSSLDATCLFGYSGRKLALGFRGYNFGAFTAFFTLDDAGDSWTAANGVNYAFGTSTGSKFGTSTSQKLGFWNATPIVQPASANQAAITDTAGATYTSAEQTMLGNLKTLVNQLRADLVSAGLIKGSA